MSTPTLTKKVITTEYATTIAGITYQIKTEETDNVTTRVTAFPFITPNYEGASPVVSQELPENSLGCTIIREGNRLTIRENAGTPVNTVNSLRIIIGEYFTEAQ